MSFLLRAALTIGVLSYLAAARREAGAPAAPPPSRAALARGLGTVTDALPAAMRERLGDIATLARATSALSEPAGSADTLSAADRRPEWRGPARP